MQNTLKQHNVKPWQPLSRRTALRAGATTIALPLLAEMLPKRALAAEVPKRAVHVCFGQGLPLMWQQDYFKGAMTPLAPFAKRLGFYRGLQGSLKGGFSHQEANQRQFTGLYSGNRESPTPPGPSIDHRLMKAWYPEGSPTPVKYLALGFIFDGDNSLLNKARAWDDKGNPVALPMDDPAQVFKTLFGSNPGGSTAGGAADVASFERRRRLRGSVLDVVLRQYQKLTSDTVGLGKASRERLSDHMDNIRTLEKRVQSMGPPLSCNNIPPTPAALTKRPSSRTASQWRSDWRLLNDLFVLGLRCDITRWATIISFSNSHNIQMTGQYPLSGGTFDFAALNKELGVGSYAHYNLHGFDGNAADRPRHQALNRGHSEVILENIADSLSALDDPAFPDANGKTILENSFLAVTTEFGTNHDANGVFHALGPCGGKFRTGLMELPGKTTRELYDTMLVGMGSKTIDGTDTAPLPTVLA
ncbi:MAG: DUF1552 domain-containing protein [Deltaproteobacteria bacterium]|nr:DUF1552 domain-containing protein [Deltaproteobacteria bacterium]